MTINSATPRPTLTCTRRSRHFKFGVAPPDKNRRARSIPILCSIAFASSLLGAPEIAFAQDETQHFPKPLRYEEDYSYLADPAQRDDLFDAIKYIPLSADRSSYLSLGGELRERLETTKSPAFGLTGIERDTVWLHRLLVSADAHIDQPIRVFIQLGAYAESGRKFGPLPTDENRLDFQQAFVDLTSPAGSAARATLRVGRQEMLFGSGRFVSIREGPNGRRSFDGVRAMYRSPSLDGDVFVSRPARLERGPFDDQSDESQEFWGAYMTRRFGRDANLDLYYLGLKRDDAVYAAVGGKERRHTIGARFWGVAGKLDYNLETAFQTGRLADLRIRAFGTSADIGYELSSLPLRPRIGIKANIESGDSRPDDGKLGTFNPLFPNHAYFSEAAFGAPMNDFDVQPNLAFNAAPRLTFLVGWDFFWKHHKADSVYNSALLPFPGTAGGGRYVGTMLTTHARWRYDRHWEFNLDLTRFDAGKAVRQAGGSDATFFTASAAYRF